MLKRKTSIIENIKNGDLIPIGWGTGRMFQHRKYIHDFDVAFTIDTREDISNADGVNVYTPEILKNIDRKKFILIIYSIDYIRSALDYCKQFPEIICLPCTASELNASENFKKTKEAYKIFNHHISIKWNLSELMKELDYYKNLTKTNEEDILLIEMHALGDLYHTLSLVEYLKEKFRPRKINLITRTHSSPGLKKLFNNIDSIYVIPDIDEDFIESITHTMWYSSQKKFYVCTPVFHPKSINTTDSSSITGFTHLKVKRKILSIDENLPPKRPLGSLDLYYSAKNSAEKQGLTSKSIIIFNHGRSFKPLPITVYEFLTRQYPGKVFYDIYGTQALKGGIPLNIKIEEIPYFADIAGTVICIRSGVTDILAMSSAQIFTLDLDSDWVHDGIMKEDKKATSRFWSTWGLKEMGLNDNAKEYKIFIKNSDNISRISEKIKNSFSKNHQKN